MSDESPYPLPIQYARSITSWQRSISEFEDAVLAAAQATADFKQARGRLIVQAKFADPKVSAVVLEAMADADDDVAGLMHQRLIAEAAVDGLKSRLIWHRAQADNLRTQVVDEREQNRLASATGAGPGAGQVPAGPPGASGGSQAVRRASSAPENPWPDEEPPTREWRPEW